MATVAKDVGAGEPKKAVKVKKVAAPKKVKAHPPYVEMIKEAILALKERTGSSQYAIAKHIEDNQKDLAPNFKKLLLIQLKKLVASGKLVKVKNSYKLAKPGNTAAAAVVPVKKASPPAATKKADPAKKKKVVVAKTKARAVTTPVKAKKSPAKAKAKPKAVKKTPTKKPKSIKSPAKKGATKKAKK